MIMSLQPQAAQEQLAASWLRTRGGMTFLPAFTSGQAARHAMAFG
jgi:hypothetical protein